jgi:hypothetical protein
VSEIDYDGTISPSVLMTFQTIKVAGTHATADENYVYSVANSLVHEFRLEVQTPGGVVAIERHATAKNALYDNERFAYICDPTPAAALQKVVDALKAASTAKASVKSLKLWVKPFFLEMLKLLTRTDADSFTLARPDAASKTAIEGSFKHVFVKDQQKKDVGIVTHPANVAKEIKEMPAELLSITVEPPLKKKGAPRVVLWVALRIKEAAAANKITAAERDEAARLFMAADYTKIYAHGKTIGRSPWYTPGGASATGIERELKQWERNVAHYLWNHTSIDRGKKIAAEVVDAGKNAAGAGKSVLDVVQIVRDEIDARLITANHWGQDREDRVKEEYQRKLSDLFGAIHQAQFQMASPVAWLRAVTDHGELTAAKPGARKAFLNVDHTAPPVTIEDVVGLAVQWGVGHCGEHSKVSWVVMRQIMNAGHQAKFVTIIHSGNANVDHAFVVGGFRIPKLIKTILSKDYFIGSKGNDANVFDLREALSGGQDGFILDPYLAPSQIPTTCKALLDKLNEESRKARPLASHGPNEPATADARTDFLAVNELGQHPPGPKPPEEFKQGPLRGL